MSFNISVTKSLDAFIPAEMRADREMHTRARMFLVSHLFGPFLGNVIPGYLLWADPKSASNLAVLAFSICGFWIFPLLLKVTGRYTLLSYISIQNLLFAILWGCFFYGGLSSPFLPWLVTVPLLAFFYLGASLRSCTAILSQIGLSLAAFIGLYVAGGEFPHTMDVADMQIIGIISIISASIYVSMMALYYAGILKSQWEFEREVKEHIETADQLREATSQALQASAAKAEFLAKMSHELRTPLNAVIGYSEILLEDYDPVVDAQSVDDVNRIHAAGRHLLSLVNAILDLSKIEAGKMKVFAEPLHVGDWMTSCAQRWVDDCRMVGRTITVNVDDRIVMIDVDQHKLEQILDAVVDNAVRYAPQSGIEIAVTPIENATDAASRIQILICDSGPGIAAELLSNLFETFNDFDDQRVSVYGGAGLGLPLSHRLCALLGGDLNVMHTTKTGTTIELIIPRSQAEDKQTAPILFDLAQAA